MLEESISCSPCNSRKKSRSRRFHKKVKKKSEQNVTTKTKNVIQNKHSNLEIFYEESKHSKTNVETHLEYFNPFENEKVLATADQTSYSQSSLTLKNLTSKGFIRLESLPLEDENKVHTSESTRSPHIIGLETEFGIRECEFAQFCNDTESLYYKKNPTTSSGNPKKIKKSKSIVEEILTDFCGSPTQSEIDEQTPPNSPVNTKRSKSIVDEILEDFCGSPFKENSPKANSEDATPVFRFKSQAIRTYSRIKRKNLFNKTNFTDFNACTIKYDGNTSDSSSGLSVQEDLTQTIVPQLDTVDLNNSVKLCENLLNLSSYFSQLPSSSSKAKSLPLIDEKSKNQDNSLSAIIDDILKIKSKQRRINWDRFETEFMGFSDNESVSKESSFQELLEDEDDILQQINYDSLCYDKIEPIVSFANVTSDIENTLQNANTLIEKTNDLIYSEPDEEKKLIKMHETGCNIQSKSLSLNYASKDEVLFDDIDIWNDNEYLLDYKTQKYSVHHVEHENKALCKDNLNDTQSVSKSKKSEVRQNVQKLKSDTKGKLLHASYKNTENLKDPCSSVSLKLSDSSKNKSIRTNNTFSNDFEKLKITPDIVKNPFSDKNSDMLDKKDNKFLSKVPAPNLVGFLTASNKPISISDFARQKADEFLKKFEEQDVAESIGIEGSEFKASKVTTKLQYDKPQTTRLGNSTSTKLFVGFTTASNKHISISNKAQRKADEILNKFEQDEKAKRMLETNEEHFDNEKKNQNVPVEKMRNDLASNVGGFRVFSAAPEKPLEISLEANRTANKISKKIEVSQIPEKESEKFTQRQPSEVSEEVRRKAQELLLDIEFFEEAFEDELKKIEDLPRTQDKLEKQISETIVYTQVTNDKIIGGFKTASRKPIHISEESYRRAETLFKMVDEEVLPQEYLKNSGETDIHVSTKTSLDNEAAKVEEVDDEIGSPKIKIDLKQMQANNGVEFFHVSENSIINLSQSESDIKSLHNLNKEVHNKIENMTFRKRKHSEGSEFDKPSSLVTSRRLSCGERVSFHNIENGLLCKSLSSPLKEGTSNSSVISRKNLLSLNKRRKFDSQRQLSDNSRPKTSENSQQTSSTPNLKHFFEMVSTSTPRLVRNEPTNSQNPSKDAIDSDFRLIHWEDSDSSLRINRTGCVDDVNVTFSTVSPSPKQRIEQLKMYGEPPPISPISMLNKCRPSGLRRGRSLMKP